MVRWNVVATTAERGFEEARQLLSAYGSVSKSPFYNVLTVFVDDTPWFLEVFLARWNKDPAVSRCIGRVLPVTETFVFQSPDEFEHKARSAARTWVDALCGKTFHVRMHRRGFKGRLSSQHEEQFLDHFLMERLESIHCQGRITFDDPECIVAVETIAQEAGLSLWSREQRRRYPFLELD